MERRADPPGEHRFMAMAALASAYMPELKHRNFVSIRGSFYTDAGRVERSDGVRSKRMFLPNLNREALTRLSKGRPADVAHAYCQHNGIPVADIPVRWHGLKAMQAAPESGKRDEVPAHLDLLCRTGHDEWLGLLNSHHLSHEPAWAVDRALTALGRPDRINYNFKTYQDARRQLDAMAEQQYARA